MVATVVTAPLFVRMTPEELGMVRATAGGMLMSASNWARRILMAAVASNPAVAPVPAWRELELQSQAAERDQGPIASPRRAKPFTPIAAVLASAAARTLPLPFKRKKLTSKVLAPKKKKPAAKLPKSKPSSRRKPLPKKKKVGR